ncbi:MAG: hypothetical protein JW720_02450 [Sedimentisphaerales bacterium]|nr:hypothetical protein [Sedimentisphaerales bacterium]
MKSMTVEMEDNVGALLSVLDEDIRYVRESLVRLDEIRALVVKRDQAGLGRVLDAIRSESRAYSVNESKRQSLRRAFAGLMDCSVKEITLSRLEAGVHGDLRIEVCRRKAKLKSLTSQLKREYARTAALLSDCARFNSVLLREILHFGRAGTITYSSDGARRVEGDSVFVSMQL